MLDLLWHICYYNNEKIQLSPAVFSSYSPFIYINLQGYVQEIKIEATKRDQYLLSFFKKKFCLV